MNKKIFFSIIIPCHNIRPSFELTLDSLRTQSFKNFEVIFVDDHSDSKFLDQLKTLLRSFDPTHSLICLESNQGPAVARNVGAKLSQGAYICLLDSDDLWTPHKLQRIFETISARDPVILGHLMKGHEVSLPSRTCELSRLDFLIRNRVTTSSLVIKKNNWIPFSRMRFCEDLDLLLKYTELNSVLILPEFLGELGHPVGSPGGQSSKHLQMRIGELRAYFNYSMRKPYRFLWFPILFIFSILKFLRLKIKMVSRDFI